MSQSNCLRLAYADPPYLGCAKRYREHPDAARWDDAAAHGDLMAELERDYDGWALSASATSLPHLLPLAPADVRVAAWVKPFSAYKKNVRVSFGWEPVIFRYGRRLSDPEAPEGPRLAQLQHESATRNDRGETVAVLPMGARSARLPRARHRR